MFKVFHVSDLHFGKTVHNIHFVDEDQPYWVDNFLNAVDSEKPDAVVIAGDIYDQKLPPEAAVTLLNYFLQKLVERNIYVFLIPGNHDSAIRLSFGNELLHAKNIFIAGEVGKELFSKSIIKDSQEYVFWLMPYIYPKLVGSKQVLDRDDISSYDMAARELLKEQSIDSSKCNILVAHQNVLAGKKKPEHSDSESIIGNLGEIDYSAFDDFSYVALGHIHNMQAMGRETVRYAGCPMYYDFSEVNRKKAVTVVDFQGKDDIKISQLEIPLLHKMVQVSGTLDELTKIAEDMDNKEKLYIKAVITDKDFSLDRDKLRDMKLAFGPTLINTVREIVDGGTNLAGISQAGGLPKNEIKDFYGNIRSLAQLVNQELTVEHKKVIDAILEYQEIKGFSDKIDNIDTKSPETIELADKILGNK